MTCTDPGKQLATTLQVPQIRLPSNHPLLKLLRLRPNACGCPTDLQFSSPHGEPSPLFCPPRATLLDLVQPLPNPGRIGKRSVERPFPQSRYESLASQVRPQSTLNASRFGGTVARPRPRRTDVDHLWRRRLTEEVDPWLARRSSNRLGSERDPVRPGGIFTHSAGIGGRSPIVRRLRSGTVMPRLARKRRLVQGTGTAVDAMVQPELPRRWCGSARPGPAYEDARRAAASLRRQRGRSGRCRVA